VAKLAGVPASVLKRANDIVNELIGNDLALKARTVPTEVEQPRCDTLYDNISLEQQFSLFSMYGNDDIITEIRDMDITNLTPIDAINKLYQLQKKINDRI
jgi:DNA mismatch repair protein MutS